MRQPILIELLAGTGAHVDPLAMVRSVDVALAGRALAGASHTIWQLVWHLDYWMDYELQSLEGREPRYPEHAAVSWPRSPAPETAAGWREEQDRFAQQLAALARWAERLSDPVVAARVVHPTKRETVHDVLWQMVAHNSYHAGQIALLLRAFGAWPPSGGGDTW